MAIQPLPCPSLTFRSLVRLYLRSVRGSLRMIAYRWRFTLHLEHLGIEEAAIACRIDSMIPSQRGWGPRLLSVLRQFERSLITLGEI